MRAPISVVIPTFEDAGHVQACLERLMEGLASGIIREVVISDGGSTDATRVIADEAGATVVTGARSMGGQLRRGCQAAKGDWLLVVHADTLLPVGWAAVVQAHMERERAGPAHFKLAFDARGLRAALVAGWGNMRSLILGLPYGHQGLLVPRALYLEKGGYPDQPIMEDLEIARRLPGMTILSATALCNAEPFLQKGWLRHGAGNLWRLARYAMGVDPARLLPKERS